MPLLSFPHPSERTPKSAFSNFIRRTESSLEKAKVQALNRLVANKKNDAQLDVIFLGGRRGIRTLEKIAPLHTFQACQFNHSCILPFLALFYTIPQRTLQACQYRSVSLRSSACSPSREQALRRFHCAAPNLTDFCFAKAQVQTLFARKTEPKWTLLFLAERTGFEPARTFPPYTLSKRAPSATRPSLLP